MITLNQPITVPPTPQKVADALWIQTLFIDASNGPTSPVVATISLCPMISSTGELLTDQINNIVVPDVMTACASSVTLGTAMQGIFAAVTELCKERSLLGFTPDTGSIGQ